MKLARRHLLQRRGVKNIVCAAHGSSDTAPVAHVANVELELGVVVLLAHVVLLLLVPAEDPDFAQGRIKESPHDSVAE